ncbi:regulator [Picrophilus oshimae]|uniref:ACT domain-containing protein n=1 Tax=Picrophilus torridus (strain ATCC 700027 / DSM 9790 / JCM 10055 / NBRC 100828 / KAW 2/3) TaxID=1122961 RepID=A0A8G2FVG6_PICTO|nr:regulator [Picrophilus oshimae]SMD30198.1 hypothetical protein SAMN02745355_0061 [Picrophilus oshimae DSM 9789]
MWNYIDNVFYAYPAERRVIQKMLNVGLSVRLIDGEPKIFCDDIEIKPNAIAKAYHVDRRVVVNMLKRIIDDETLYSFFSNLKSMANLSETGSRLGMGVIEITPEDANRPGIISGVIRIISDHGISIRQVVTDDPDLIENPKAFIITQGLIPSSLLNDIKRVSGVKAITIL